MNVSNVMTRRVISVSPDMTILTAIRLMLKHHISGLPVIDGKDKLVGIVTESDFLHRSETGTERRRSRWLDAFFGPADAANDYVRSHGLKVENVMNFKPVTVTEKASLEEVVHLMETRKVKRLPVVRRGKLVGIVSRADLLLALASIHRSAQPSSGDDTAIRDRITAAIAEQDWAAGTSVEVTVRNGVVFLWGTISDVAQCRAIEVLVEATPGVKKVQDHLLWEGEPVSPT
jgi:CBS domain-containing protein